VPNPVASPTPSQIGIGDGATTIFQAGRVRGGALHYLYNVNSTNRAPRIYLNGTLQVSGYTINSSAAITFGSAPGSGVTVAIDFQYYYRVRFEEDSIESENVAGPYFKISSVKLFEVLA
jgi:uncharacterized protein (TIGR02217 family)